MSKRKYPYTARRVFATLIDYAVVLGVSFFYLFKFGTEESPGHFVIYGLPALFPVAFWFAFIILTERYVGGTLGHQICQIKVMSLDGNQLSLVQVILRRIMDALEISVCFGLIAFILVKVDQQNQRLGDKIAKTKVVGKSDSYADIKFEFER